MAMRKNISNSCLLRSEKSWIPTAGDTLSDEEGIQFFKRLTETGEIPVSIGSNLITSNIEFSYLAKEEDGTLSADILDKINGASLVIFSSKINESPKILIKTKTTYDCEDQDFRRVKSAFPCDYEHPQ